MDRIESDLRGLDATAEKIRGLTRSVLRFLDQGGDAHLVVKQWFACLKDARENGDNVLPYLFCCNDMLQESKRLDKDALLGAFEMVLVDAVGVLSEDYSINDQVSHVVNIWNKRKVLSPVCLEKLLVEIGEKDDQDPEDTESVADETGSTTGNQSNALESMPVSRLLTLYASIKFDENETKGSLAQAAELAKEANLDSLSVEELNQLLEKIGNVENSVKLHQSTVRQISEVESALINQLEEQIGTQSDTIGKNSDSLAEVEKMEGQLRELKERFANDETRFKDGTLLATFVANRRVRKKKVLPAAIKKSVVEETQASKKDSEQPMYYNKQLKKYMPLPSLNEEDSWRDR